jgi:hypothetical protein
MPDELQRRISMLLSDPPAGGEDVDALLTEGYARALKLDSDRLALERHITQLAARAGDAGAAQELRRAWLRHRTLGAELRDLRALLRRLRDQAPV